MQTENEYAVILQHLYQRSLILHDTSLFHPVLKFYFIDALAHLDYTLGTYAYNIQSPKNIMAGEYLRWRIDEEKKGDRPRFGAFVEWLKAEHPESFEKLPTLWQMIYDSVDPAQYRSFRIILNPDSKAPIPARFFRDAIEEFFEKAFLKSLYEEASLSTLLNEFLTKTG